VGLRVDIKYIPIDVPVMYKFSCFEATYSNLDNHPRMIRARETKSVAKIRLDRRTGLPIVVEQTSVGNSSAIGEPDVEDSVDVRMTITRPRDETKDDKKLRKQTVKADRRARRADKKSTKEQFSAEIKRQSTNLTQKTNTKLRKL